MKRRSLSIILTLAMLLSMLPAPVLATGPEDCPGECEHKAAIGELHYDTLSAAILDAQSVDTITLLDDVTLTGTHQYKDKELTILGDGHTITFSFANKGQGIYVYKSAGKNASLTVENATFTGHSSFGDDYSVIDGAPGTAVTLTECVFTGNTGDYVIRSNGAKLEVSGCAFYENSVSKGVITCGVNGNSNTTTIDNCTFTGNSIAGTAVVYLNKEENQHFDNGRSGITNCTFTENDVTASAAAVLYLSIPTTVTGNLLSENMVTGTGSNTGKCGIIASGSDGAGSSVTGNAFVDNTVTTTGTNHIATAYIGSADVTLNDNYWGDGEAPEQGSGKDVYLTKTGLVLETYAYGYERNGSNAGVTVDLTQPEVEPEASIDGTPYPTLAEAIANANGKTVVLEKHITLSNVGITVPAGTTVTLELNGKVLSGVSNVASATAVIINNGTLTIQDSVGGGKITTEALNFDQGAIPGYANNTITNSGVLTVKSGTVENGTAAGGTACYAIDNNSTLRNTKLTVKGSAEVISANHRAIRVFQNSRTNTNDIIIDGGKVSGGKDGTGGAAIWVQQCGTNSIGSLTVTGGELYGRSNAVVVDTDKNGTTEVAIEGGEFSNEKATANLLLIWPFDTAQAAGTASATLNISGGTFNKTGDTAEIIDVLYDALATISVTGGTFNAAPKDDYVAETHKIVSYNNGADVYKAVPADAMAYNVEKDTTYPTLSAAIAAVSNDECIVVLAENSESVKVRRAVRFTLDENGVFAGSVTAGSGYKLSVSDGVYTFTKKSSSKPTPTPDPEPTPSTPEIEEPEITQPEAPKVDTTPDTSSPTVNEEVKENTDGTTTKTETKEDGTKVETTTGSDGSSTTTASKTETKENADGSTTTSTATNTSTTTATGDKVTEEKVEEVVKTETSTTTTTATKTETQTASGDKVTQEKVEAKVENTDGSTTTTTATKTETQTASGEKVTEEKKEEVKENTDGSVATTTSTKTETQTASGEKVTEQKVEEKMANTDGSATTTTTTVTQSENKTETTKAVEKVTVDENGEQTVTTQSQTDTALSNGSTGTTTVSEDGSVKAEVTVTTTAVAETAKDETVALPMPEIPASTEKETAAVVEVSIPTAAVVEIPVENAPAGAVVVIVHADGTEELVKDCYVTENGVAVGLEGDATIKIVDNSKEFDDVREDQWFHDAADFMSARGLMSGTAEGQFSPDQDSSRAMVWTMMASLNNAETTGGATWFEKSQDWAKENGISDGTDPDGSIAREQLAVMLWRQAGSPASGRSFADFNDADSISGWAEEAMRWALENGIMGGKGNGVLDPKGNASRGEVAQMFKNFVRYTAHN